MYNKNNLEIYKVASKDETKVILGGVYFTGDSTVATDSSLLMEVSVPKQNIEDFPIVGEELVDVHEPFILEAKAVRDLIKDIPKNSSLPILENIVVAKNKDKGVASLVTTDLSITNVHKVRKIIGEYPKHKQLFPEEEPAIKLRLDPQLLKKVAELYCKTLEAGSSIEIFVHKSINKPIEFRAFNTETKQEIKALLMQKSGNNA